ncbi:hypothetical protein AB0M86_32695 [Streptomyces sp. NPDC051639]|uniref:hypothetical protein n=1 Tax=unclassified Streptomyces TaxID=2593676 RepID=UPI00143EC1BD|nr:MULTISPECIES: hypothetical protein [unclassified Streptomyces]QIY66268.1 hypothetical protein HEP85_37835 [Streptomyces sp. RPA4-2]
MTVLIGLLGAVFGGLAGAAAGFLTNRANMLMQLRHSYDLSVRDRRLEHYATLFHLTERVPRRWRSGEEPDRAQLLAFARTFHDWYFSEKAGGMFLTPAAKTCYLALQDALIAAASQNSHGEPTRPSLAEEESRMIRHLASELRHQLAEDVGTAHPSHLRWERVDPTIEDPRVAPPTPRGTHRFRLPRYVSGGRTTGGPGRR